MTLIAWVIGSLVGILAFLLAAVWYYDGRQEAGRQAIRALVIMAACALLTGAPAMVYALAL